MSETKDTARHRILTNRKIKLIKRHGEKKGKQIWLRILKQEQAIAKAKATKKGKVARVRGVYSRVKHSPLGRAVDKEKIKYKELIKKFGKEKADVIQKGRIVAAKRRRTTKAKK